MSYILGEIFVCLLIAGLIGLFIGWLLSKVSYNKKFKNLEKIWRVKVVDIKDDYAQKLSLFNEKLKSNNNLITRFIQDDRIKDAKVKAYKSIVDEYKKDNKTISNKLLNEKEQLEQKIKELEKTIEQKDQEYKEKYENLLKESDDKYKNLEEENKVKIQILNKQVGELKKELDETTKGKKEIENKLIEYQNRISDSQKKLSFIELEFEKLKTQYKDKENTILSLKEEIEIKNDKLKEMDNFKTKLEELEQKFRFVISQKHEQDRFVESLKERLDKKSNIEKEILTYKSTIQSLKKQLQDKTKLESKNIELNKKINILQMQIEKQETLMKKLENEIKEYRGKVQELNKQIIDSDEIWRQRIENLLKAN